MPGLVRSGVCRGHGPPMPSAWTEKEGSRRSGAAGRRALLRGGEPKRQDGFEGRIPAYRDGLRLLNAFVHLNIPNFMNICSLRGLRLQERLKKCLSLRNSQTVLGGELNIKEQDLRCEGGNCSRPGAQGKEQSVLPAGDSGACAEEVPVS